jgi:hypothetical protein
MIGRRKGEESKCMFAGFSELIQTRAVEEGLQEKVHVLA